MDDHFILEIDNFLPESLCKEIIKRYENEPDKKQSRIGVDPDNGGGILDLARRNSKEIDISVKPNWSDIDKIFYGYLKKAVDVYRKEIAKKLRLIGEDPDFCMDFILGNNVQDGGYTVQRVEKNSWFRWHHDQTYDNRILNVICYLNTLDESEGGRTEFIHGRKIIPKAGKILFFPSTWTNLHCGSWVKNYKYICVTSLFKK